MTTEVGRQPWIVYQLMTVTEAINPAHGLRYGLSVVLAIYTTHRRDGGGAGPVSAGAACPRSPTCRTTASYEVL